MEPESMDTGDFAGRMTTRHNLRRPVQEKVRHKRQTLRDMTKPLKQWLYRNRDNPYPSKADKMTLALSSQMTLTQVSNWFANARRRLKNTVVEPDLNWSKRIKRYNKHANGNQELLSISSGSDTESEDNKTEKELDLSCTHEEDEEDEGEEVEEAEQSSSPGGGISAPAPPPPAGHHAGHGGHGGGQTAPEHGFKSLAMAGATPHPESSPGSGSGSGSGQHKFSQTILSRYLNDSYQHQQSLQLMTSRGGGGEGTRHRNTSGSLSSHDFEDLSSSSRSTPIREQLLSDDGMEEFEEFHRHWPDRVHGGDDLYWKEIGAALALTTLARSRHNSGASTMSRLSTQ